MTNRSKRSTIFNSRLGYLTQALGGNDPIGANDPESEAETCPATIGFVMNMVGNRGELEVYLTTETAIYDENGQLILPENLGNYIGDVVRTRGDFNAEDQYEASLVIIGPVLASKIWWRPKSSKTSLRLILCRVRVSPVLFWRHAGI